MPNTLEFDQLKSILPQAYPLVMIDRVVDYTPGKDLTAIKNITANDWAFSAMYHGGSHHIPKSPGHKVTGLQETKLQEVSVQPEMDIFPETLLIEAAAQAALVLYHLSKDRKDQSRLELRKVMSEFSDSVFIGDSIKVKASVGKMLADKGFSNIVIEDEEKSIGNVEIFYACLPAGRG